MYSKRTRLQNKNDGPPPPPKQNTTNRCFRKNVILSLCHFVEVCSNVKMPQLSQCRVILMSHFVLHWLGCMVRVSSIVFNCESINVLSFVELGRPWCPYCVVCVACIHFEIFLNKLYRYIANTTHFTLKRSLPLLWLEGPQDLGPWDPVGICFFSVCTSGKQKTQ